MPAPQEWLSQQIAEFLAVVSSYRDETTAVEGAVERAAEAVEAEVGAIIRDGAVVTSVGFPHGAAPEAALVAAAAGRDPLQVPGLGPCSVLAVPLESGTLVLARSGAKFSREESALVRGFARVLCLTLRMVRVLETERRLRQESEAQAEENSELLVAVQERQALLERLFRIQRSISHRVPIQEVLDSITEGAAELLGDEVAAVRLVDEDDPLMTRLVSAVGMSPDLRRALELQPVTRGVAGRVLAEGRLITAADYAAGTDPFPQLVDDGLRSAMGAPVCRDGVPVGCLAVATHSADRSYTAVEQEVLLAFAEHASLALNDASAVEALRRAFSQAVHEATHDPLTGLPNRTLVLDRLQQALARVGRSGVPTAVLFIDLDRFKVVNDSLGHATGDEALILISQRLRAAVRTPDTVGRLAGDEFVVICEETDCGEAFAVAERIARAVAEPLLLAGGEAVVTASIGIVHGDIGAVAEEMLRDSDVAMYRAKERGRSRIEIFDHAMRQRMLDRLEMERDLRTAIASEQLRLHYQPIVRLADGEVVAVEALLRWERPGRGPVGPVEFIPVAEESGLILPLGQWVLGEACTQLAAWRAGGRPALRVSVNLSARQFGDPDLVQVVAGALAAAGLSGDALCLEITESVLMEEAEATVETLRALKALGVRLSVDDFGTGYSSLGYLKRFPVDVLKVDRSFVNGLADDPEDEAIVAAVIGLAQALKLEVVAEGVETPDQLRKLRELGCDAVQGYLCGRPCPPGDLVSETSSLVLAMA